MRSSLRGAAALVGLAETAPVRDTGDHTDLSLAAEVATAAVNDAGLDLTEVDGLLTHPMGVVSRLVPSTVAEALGLRLSYADSVDLGGATAVGMVWRAAAAVLSGMCSICLCVTAVPRPADATALGGPSRRTTDRSPAREFEVPYGNVGATEGYAMIAQRYEHEFGCTAGQRAKIAVQQRENAARHPHAFFRGKPLTAEEVLGSEMIADPLRKLEMVLPTGGASAVVVTRRQIAARLTQSPVLVLGAGEAITHKSITYAPQLTTSAIRASADRAFEMAGIGREQVNVASVYDCYTITALMTLEDAGFCAKGEGAAFVDEHDLRWSGDFPVNTNGGQLSFGQADVVGGMSHVTESVLQLQARAPGRQVEGAEIAFVNGNGGIMSEQSSVILAVGG